MCGVANARPSAYAPSGLVEARVALRPGAEAPGFTPMPLRGGKTRRAMSGTAKSRAAHPGRVGLERRHALPLDRLKLSTRAHNYGDVLQVGTVLVTNRTPASIDLARVQWMRLGFLRPAGGTGVKPGASAPGQGPPRCHKPRRGGGSNRRRFRLCGQNFSSGSASSGTTASTARAGSGVLPTPLLKRLGGE
jgi:hypothetical protein